MIVQNYKKEVEPGLLPKIIDTFVVFKFKTQRLIRNRFQVKVTDIMRFIFFRTSKPNRFNYRPRYYNPEREELERKRAKMGLDAKLTEQEELRMRMSARWRKQNPVEFGNRYKKMSFIIYGSVILIGIYVIFFTRFIENLLSAFGLTL